MLGDEVPGGTIMEVRVGDVAIALADGPAARADDSLVAIKICPLSEVGGAWVLEVGEGA